MDQHRMDRVGLLSPLEESSAEISRDSGIVSQSTSSLSMVSEILSSGTVSQSPSFGAAANVPPSPSLDGGEEPRTAEPEFTEQDEEILRHAALGYSSYVRVTAGEEVGVVLGSGLVLALAKLQARLTKLWGLRCFVFLACFAG